MSILLAGWVIGPLTEMVIGRLTGGLTDIPVDMLTEVFIAAVVVVVSTCVGVAPALYVTNVRSKILFDTDVSIDVMVDVLVGVLVRAAN